MTEPLSPNYVFDFPTNDPALKLEDPVMEVEEDSDEEPEENPEEEPEEDSNMDVDKDEEDEWEEDEWEEDDDWLMIATPEFLPWIPLTQPNTYEVGGPSSAIPNAPHPVGRPLLVVASRVALHHKEIRALHVRADEMESKQTRTLSLVRKVDGLSDAQVADSISIGKFQPKITIIEEGVKIVTGQGELVASKLDDTETQVLEMRDIVDNNPHRQVDALREEVDGLHGSTVTMSQRVQILETILQEVSAKNQDLQTRLSASESSERCLVAFLLWMEERISALEQRSPGPHGPPNGSRGAEEARENAGGVEGAGTGNVGGNITSEIRGCLYKTFLNYKPYSFNGTEGVVGLSRWFKKMKSVFEISKCIDEEKVKYIVCTLEGHALTWWNGNGYTNRFHELAVMCPALVTPEYKKIRSYIWGLHERVQGNVTSSKPVTIHEAITMARGLVDQAVRVKETRINDSNKKKWEEQ
ncbi:hypothetical protein Tco_0938917 [Tanacetum coccineum]|uniref:Retrotransposon gag domain-containing protein n=1 Tax=Tanacetum coccineum TaxID=301880 RepID=A0ABQ5DJE7_9ASTR